MNCASSWPSLLVLCLGCSSLDEATLEDMVLANPKEPVFDQEWVWDAEYLPRHRLFAIARADGLALWDLERQRVVQLSTAAFGALTATDTRLFAGSLGAPQVHVWDLDTHALLDSATMATPQSDVFGVGSHGPPPPRTSLALAPDGQRLAVAHLETVAVFDLELRPLWTLRVPGAEGVDDPNRVVSGFESLQSVGWTSDGRSVQAFLGGRYSLGGWRWCLDEGVPEAERVPYAPPNAHTEGHPDWRKDRATVEDRDVATGVELRVQWEESLGRLDELARRTERGEVRWRKRFPYPGDVYSRFAVAEGRVFLFGGATVTGHRIATRVFDLETGAELEP